MEAWKRNNLTYEDIIKKDLGNNGTQWFDFLNQDVKQAFELIPQDVISGLNFYQLVKTYELVKEYQLQNDPKIDFLKEEIVRKAEDAAKTQQDDIVRDFPDDLENELWEIPWYRVKKCKERTTKLMCASFFTMLLACIAAFAVNLSRNGMDFVTKGAIVILGLSVIMLVCVLIASWMQGRIISRGAIDKWPLIIGAVTALGTAGYLVGIFVFPDVKLWFVPISIWIVICFFMALWIKKKTHIYTKLWIRPFWLIIAFVPLMLSMLYISKPDIGKSLYTMDNLQLANTCHDWKWHKQETHFFDVWRKEPDGLYKRWNNDLRKDSIWKPFNKAAIGEAYEKLAKNDPIDRQCQKYKAPWYGDFKKWLADKCRKVLDGKIDEKSCELICNYIYFYWEKFGEQPVDSKMVLEKLFRHEITRREKDGLRNVRTWLEGFMERCNVSEADVLNYALIPAMRTLLEEIKNDLDKTPEQREDVVMENDARHSKFKYLSSMHHKYGGDSDDKVLTEYSSISKNRDEKITAIVRAAAEKYLNETVSSDWVVCPGTWLEEFSNKIPVACFILWKYGHPGIENGQKNSSVWRKYLENDQAGKIAESSYYSAEINSIMKDNEKALEYYKVAVSSSEKTSFFWLNNARHQIVKLTSDDELKWKHLQLLYEAKDLRSDELLTFARMAVNHGKYPEALDVYNACPDNILNIDDLFVIVKLNTEQKGKLAAFDRLAGRLEKVLLEGKIEQNIIEQFTGTGIEINAGDATYALLRKAVVKGCSEANKSYISVAEKYNRLDEDAAEKLIGDKSVDKKIIGLAGSTRNDALFLKEALRWADEKYEGYQKHLLDAGEIAFSQKHFADAGKLWGRLEDKELDQVCEKYLTILDDSLNTENSPLSNREFEYYSSRSFAVKDVKRITKLAVSFESRKDYVRAVYFWDKVREHAPEKQKGNAYYKLYECSEKKIGDFSATYYFDEDAQKVYSAMNAIENRRANVFNAAFKYYNKTAVFFLAELVYTVSDQSDFYPKNRGDELKTACVRLRDAGGLTDDEKKNVDRYLSALDESMP